MIWLLGASRNLVYSVAAAQESKACLTELSLCNVTTSLWYVASRSEKSCDTVLRSPAHVLYLGPLLAGVPETMEVHDGGQLGARPLLLHVDFSIQTKG